MTQGHLSHPSAKLAIAHSIYGAAAFNLQADSVRVTINDSRGMRIIDSQPGGIRAGPRSNCREVYYLWDLAGSPAAATGRYTYCLTYRSGPRQQTVRGEIYLEREQRRGARTPILTGPLQMATVLLAWAFMLGMVLTQRIRNDAGGKSDTAVADTTEGGQASGDLLTPDGTVRAGKKAFWVLREGQWERLTVAMPGEVDETSLLGQTGDME